MLLLPLMLRSGIEHGLATGSIDHRWFRRTPACLVAGQSGRPALCPPVGVAGQARPPPDGASRIENRANGAADQAIMCMLHRVGRRKRPARAPTDHARVAGVFPAGPAAAARNRGIRAPAATAGPAS